MLPAESEIEFTYARSSGPGGQNVNKVNTKAVLRWNLLASKSFTPFKQTRLVEKLGPKLTRDGCVLIASDRYRDQIRNREDCLEKLAALIERALKIELVRRESKPTRSSVRRRLTGKAKTSEKKQSRARVGKSSRFD